MQNNIFIYNVYILLHRLTYSIFVATTPYKYKQGQLITKFVTIGIIEDRYLIDDPAVVDEHEYANEKKCLTISLVSLCVCLCKVLCISFLL